MAYGRLRAATRLATAALLAAGCGRFGFEDRDPPVDAEPPCSPAVQIAELDAGNDFYCARLTDNSLQCWGANDVGQLGDSTRATALAAVRPLSLPDVEAFATGYQHACAVRQGNVWCWGRNDIGQLGQSDRFGRAVPARVNGLPGDMLGVATGGLSTCAWTSTGALYCWGQTTGTNTSPSNTPRLVAGLPAIRAVALSSSRALFSNDHACALGTDGSTWCWGDNQFYALGTGAPVESATPVAVTAPAFEAITAGNAHTCARTNGNELYCWGLNVDGEAGVPGQALVMVPTRIPDIEAAEVDASGEMTCARTPAGDVYCMGDNDFRQLGRDGDDALSPERIDVPPSVRLAVGSDSSCALGVDGVLRCWGPERSGVFSGTVTPPTTTTIPGVVAIAAGGDNTCARTSDGRVLCWGLGSLGLLGDGAHRPATAEPVQIPLPRAAVSHTVGVLHMCATLDDNSVSCWGFNEARQVDSSTTGVRPVVIVGGVPAQTGVTAGATHSCAYNASDNTWCWGNNSEGALGISNSISSSPPAQSLLPAMRVMEAGRHHTCGITPAGALVCSGRNNEGQIGDGVSSDTYTPYTHPFAQPVVSVGAGDNHTCAVTSGPSTVWCWGDDVTGELGLGQDVQSSTPAIVGVSGTVVELVAGSNHSCSRDDSGVVSCWGSNADGQLGDGSLASVATPTVSTELAGATMLAAGERHTCGLLPSGDIRCVGANDAGQLGAPIASMAPRQAVITCPR